MTPLVEFDLLATSVFALEGGLAARLAGLGLLGVLSCSSAPRCCCVPMFT